MLYLIGLGLGPDGISVLGLKILKKCDKIYMEQYTSISQTELNSLKSELKTEIIPLDRKTVEETDLLIRESQKHSVAFLIPGDPLVATTHSSLLAEARKNQTPVQIIHSSSIYSAVAETGLQLYKFGKTTTLPFPDKEYENYKPTSPYETIQSNLQNNSHTLILLDIQVTQNKQNYMTIQEALPILKDLESKLKKKLFTSKTKIVAISHLGQSNQLIKYNTMETLNKTNFGPALHCLIYPAKDLHFQEKELLETYS